MKTRIRKIAGEWVCQSENMTGRKVYYCGSWREAIARAVAIEYEPFMPAIDGLKSHRMLSFAQGRNRHAR